MLYIPPLEGEVCTTIMKKELESNQPSMIARFGSVEIKAILYPSLPRVIQIISFSSQYFGKRVFRLVTLFLRESVG